MSSEEEEIDPSSFENEEELVPFDVCIVLPTKERHKKKKKKKKDHEEDPWDAVEQNDDEEESAEEALAKGKSTKMFRQLVTRMERAGLEYESYYSIQKDEIYVKIKIPTSLLYKQADALNFKMRFDENRLADAMALGYPEDGIKPIVLGSEINGIPVSKYRPTEFIYGKFDIRSDLIKLYECPEGKTSPFRSMHRIKIISDILQGPRRYGGCEIPIAKRISQKKFLAFLPLHNPKGRSEVELQWRSVAPWRPDLYPINRFRSYFGESLALYFCFISFLACYYAILTVPGVAFYIALRIVGYDNGPAAGILRAIYAIIVQIWAAILSLRWQVFQDKLALRWGMVGFEKDELPRPQFKGTVIASPINGTPEIFFPARGRRRQIVLSTLISALVVFLDLLFIWGVNEYRDEGAKNGDQTRATIASFLNAIGIQVFKYVYDIIARRLTQTENWRTETQYVDKLTTKLFVFNFINSNFSLLTTLFAASTQTCATPLQCTNVLEQSLQTIYLLALASDIFNATLVPYLTRKYNIWIEGGFSKAMSGPEWEYVLLEYDETLDSISAYMAASTSFGYVSLFSAAAPITPLYAALTEAVLVRLEGLKFLTGYRRIEPRGAQDIGRFEGFIALQGILSAVTSAAIVILLSPPFDSTDLAYRRYAFVISAAIAIIVQLVIRAIGSGTDEDIDTQLKRQDFIVDKVINKVIDDDELIKLDSKAEPTFDIEDKDPSNRYYNNLSEVIADSRIRAHKRRRRPKHDHHRGDEEDYASFSTTQV